MAKGYIRDTLITNIADAVRARNGSSTTYLPSEIPSAMIAAADTSQATVSAEDVITGRTIYGRNGLITGTWVPDINVNYQISKHERWSAKYVDGDGNTHTYSGYENLTMGGRNDLFTIAGTTQITFTALKDCMVRVQATSSWGSSYTFNGQTFDSTTYAIDKMSVTAGQVISDFKPSTDTNIPIIFYAWEE